jgi:hypothetical protein
MLAERIVGLSWRLRRAERMESQALDHLIIRTGGDGPDTFTILRIPLEDRKVMVEDGGALMRDLSLGQAVVKDFTNYRVLDRLMLYERRMENSMVKMIRELKQLQAARRAEETGTVERQSAQESPQARRHRSNMKNQSQFAVGQKAMGQLRHRSNLKKQSQFAPALMGTKSCARKDYNDRTPAPVAANKANQTQPDKPTTSPTPAARSKTTRTG